MRTTCFLRVCVAVAGVVGTLGSSGCASMSNTEKGAFTGGALGTAAGLGVGALTHNPKTGAIVGGLAGGAIGAMAGADKDDKIRQERDVQQASAIATAQAQAQQRMMGLTDVIHMAKEGHDDAVIVGQIRATGSTFQLTGSDLDFLKNNGVSGRVIAEMQSARPNPYPTRVIVRDPTPQTVIVREPYPGPVFVQPYYGPPRPVIYAGGCYRFH